MEQNQKSTVSLNELASRNHYSLIQVKAYLNRYKKHGVLFFPVHLDFLQFEDEIELYLCFRPILSCRNAFPISHRRFRHFNERGEQTEYLKKQYEIYYGEPCDEAEKGYFDSVQVYGADEYIWFYK